MNKYSIIFAFILYGISSVYAAGDVYKIGVDGLACPFCVYGVEKQLNKIEGIENMEADIQDGKIVLLMREGSLLSEESVRQAVTRAGFTLRSFTHNESSE